MREVVGSKRVDDDEDDVGGPLLRRFPTSGTDNARNENDCERDSAKVPLTATSNVSRDCDRARVRIHFARILPGGVRRVGIPNAQPREGDPRCDGDVQRVDAGLHRDPNAAVGPGERFLAEPLAFGAEQQRRRR